MDEDQRLIEQRRFWIGLTTPPGTPAPPQILLFYCTTGFLSLRAAKEAAATGLLPAKSTIFVLSGGYAAWIATGVCMCVLRPFSDVEGDREMASI